METWNLTDEVRSAIQPQVEEYISILESNEVTAEHKSGLDFTFKGISPMQLKELLEELGYEEAEFESNGWEYDFWQNMINNKKKRYAKKLCIYGCGMSFSLKLCSDVDG